MSAAEKQIWTVEQYLEMERASEEKHEYLNGEIYLMSGASFNHNMIIWTILGIFYNQLSDKPCFVSPSDLRIRIGENEAYTYPDVSVVCEQPLIDNSDQDTLLNPTLIMEVLSRSTEAYDRGKKFQHYRTIESLQEYVLVSQDQPRIERYLRQPNNQWTLTDAVGLDATLELSSVQSTLKLVDVYKKVTFESE